MPKLKLEAKTSQVVADLEGAETVHIADVETGSYHLAAAYAQSLIV